MPEPSAAPESSVGKRWRLSTVQLLGFKEELVSERPETFGYRVQSNAMLDEENRSVPVVVKLEAVDGEGDGAEVVGEAEVLCVFELADPDEWKDDEGEIRIPRPLLASWLGITLSTARGAIVAKAQSPVFGLAPFPVVSPARELDQLMDLSDKEWVADS